MYLRKIKHPQGIYLAIQESCYDSSSKQSRTRTIESFGYLEKLKNTYDDPIAHFTQYAKELTEQKKKEKSKKQSKSIRSRWSIIRKNMQRSSVPIERS